MDVANAFLATVHAELRDSHGSETFRDCVEAAIQEHSYRETTFSVFDAQGKLILASPVSPPLLEPEVSRYDALRLQATSGEPIPRPFRTLKASHRLYRGYSRTFAVEGATYTLVTLQSLHGEQEFFDALEQTYALVIPLAFWLKAYEVFELAKSMALCLLGTTAGALLLWRGSPLRLRTWSGGLLIFGACLLSVTRTPLLIASGERLWEVAGLILLMWAAESGGISRMRPAGRRLNRSWDSIWCGCTSWRSSRSAWVRSSRSRTRF
jgi:hypothetical protein